jgi:TRAP-type C4-dicarboxylate transport system permease small subunit
MKIRLLTKTNAVFDYVADFLAIVAGFLIIAVMLLMTFEAFLRYFFRIGLAWATEISEYMLFLIGFFGAAWLLKKRGHVSLDMMNNLLNPKAQTILNMVTSAIGVIVCLIIAWYSMETAVEYFKSGVDVVKSLSIPKAPFLVILSLGTFMLSVQFLRDTYHSLRDWRKNKAT